MLDVINRTAGQVFMPLTVGGGISTVQDIRNALNAGADKISVNTAAVKNPQLIADGAKLFGSQCIVLAVDAKRCGTDKWEFMYMADVPLRELMTGLGQNGGRIGRRRDFTDQYGC